MSPPLALSDAKLTAIMHAAQPLRPADRGAFLQAIADRLKGQAIGDGAVYQAGQGVCVRALD